MKLIGYQCPVCGAVREDSDIEEFVWCTSEQCDCNDIQMQPREVGVFNVEVEIEPTFWAKEKK